MFEEVAAYLVLAPLAGALLAVLGWLGWTHGRRRLAGAPITKERRVNL